SDNFPHEAFSYQFLGNGEIDVDAAFVETSHGKVLGHFLPERDHLTGNCVVSIIHFQRVSLVCLKLLEEQSSICRPECFRDLVGVSLENGSESFEVRFNYQLLELFFLCEANEPDIFRVCLLKE